ncbi:SMI1/KNR4 family protein [Allomuricauda sp. XS_ASV26]|uniref:SMI1/KNR4 family protein n=1 Tax=Flavobacteriaceae TaxID=49546 RepID=UPI0020750359|nr:SMI1/KNR4 family protein [Allomuricauda aquimarina]USD26418.1 SMI1/KNR4 family protein [Allomuricauda aquimarina]
MPAHSTQIQRIKNKLVRAKEKDKLYKVFGAGGHKYQINAPIDRQDISAFEHNFQIKLPECYKHFVLHIGNEGSSYQNSGAGPYFGIYPFGQHLDDLIYNHVEKHLKRDCILHPFITQKQWDEWTDPLYEDNISDTDFEELNGQLYGGILPLGSQGCSFIHALVLNGNYKGRVVNLDRGELSPPKFSEDLTFLDWYERWLDEIISGKLITNTPSWFGYPKN